MAKRFKYALKNKEESENGIVSTKFAAVSFGLFLFGILLSFFFRGKAGIPLGALGWMGIAFSLYGFVKGIQSFSEVKKSHRYSVAGSILNGIFTVVWFALFLVGVS